MKRLIKALRGFRCDDKGSIVLESVIVMPFMLWAYVGLFVYWDAFRSVNTVQKAAYTVSDMISREQSTITPAYLTGMDTLMKRLIGQSQNVSMRVTSVYCAAELEGECNDLGGQNQVHWSVSPGGLMTALTTATLQPLIDQIPAMSDGDFVVIVEVSVGYNPSFNVGLSDLDIRQFIVTRPRFLPRICIQGFVCEV